MRELKLSPKRLFWLAYPTAKKSWRKPKKLDSLDIHRLRDTNMLLDLSSIAIEAGYNYSGLILNFPELPSGDAKSASVKCATVKSKIDIGPNDLVVLGTRAPLDDEEDEKRAIDRSGTEIENSVLTALRVFFKRLSRREAILSDEVALLPSASPEITSVQFNDYEGIAAACGTENLKKKDRFALAYLLTIPSVPTFGARLLAAWGMGGRETFVWGHLLRTDPECRKLVADLISAPEPRLIIRSFLPPKQVPYPIPHFNANELQLGKLFWLDITIPGRTAL